MKKKFTFLMAAIMLLTMMVLPGKAVGEDWSHSFSSGEIKTSAGNITINTKSWTQTAATYIGWDSSGKGIQIGSGNNPTSSFSLSTSAFSSYTISNITVNSSIASKGNATMSIKVGSTTYLNSQSLTTSAADYSCTPNVSGNIEISWYNSASKAFYVKSISVTYTTGGSTYTVTYNKNGNDVEGNVPVDGTSYSSTNNTVTVQGNVGTPSILSRTGYTWGGWCLTPACDGTIYGPHDGQTHSYTISASTNFYAKWNPNSYDYELNVSGDDAGATATLNVDDAAVAPEAKIQYGKEVSVVVTVNSGFAYSIVVKDGEDNDVTVENNKFTMPASDVTVTVTTEVSPYVYATLSSSDMQSMSNSGSGYGTIKAKTINGLKWETNGYQTSPSQSSTPYGMIQLRRRNNGTTGQDPTWIKLPEFTGKIETITLSVTDAASVLSPSGGGEVCKAIMCFQGTNAVDASIVSENGNSSTGAYEITLDLSSSFYSTGYITVKNGSKAGRIWNISVKYRPYQDMSGTTLPTTLDEDVTISIPSNTNATASSLTIPASSGIVIKSGASLTVSGTLTNSGNANNIIIEDGGQLITSSAVDLTYKKSIVSAAKNGGWYTLSTPVHTGSNLYVTPSNVENLILSSDDKYDLFRYQESNHYWLNYKITAFNLNIGQGYIYRNDGHELHFTGTNNNSASYDYALSYSEAAGNLKGFNLIGNPYPQDITMSDVSVGGGSLTGGYVLSNAGGWSPDVAAKIAPTQGFLVQINQTGVTATISKPSSGEKSNHDYLKLIVANDQYEDVAFALFEEGYGLNKIDHRNSDIPMLYIPKGADNFAIATMSGETQSFNLNFKAKTTGKYTLSYKATRNYKYLHIIDRFTGEDVDMLLDGDYSFIGSPQDNAERFIVKLSYDNGSSTGSETFAYQSGNEIVVNGEGTLEVYDVTGRKVMNTVINGVETINGLNSGVYVFRVIGETLRTQKIVVR